MTSGRIASALSQCALFYGRPIHALTSTGSLREYAAGQPIFRVDEPATHLVVLVTGRAATAAVRLDGSARVVAGYRAPQAVAEAGICASDRRHRLSASAVTDVEAVLVPRDALLRAAADDTVLTDRLLTLIADTAAPASPPVADVEQRVLAGLRELATAFGVAQPDGSVLIGVRVTQSELGALIGATGPEVSAALKALTAAEQVERLGEHYLLTAPTA